jgi:hypothetical protein
MERHEIIQLLDSNICEVTFTKVDGSVRVMPCTLNPAHLPPVTEKPVTEAKTNRKFNPDVVSAYCMDKQEWRSFRVANVTEVKVLDNN